MPSTALEKAAEAASATLGLSVEVAPIGLVEIYGPMDGEDGEQPVATFPVNAFTVNTYVPEDRALAYLEGLATGARLVTKRYAPLVSTARALLLDFERGAYPKTVPICIPALFANALAELED